MEQTLQRFNNNPLPSLADVIAKIKQQQELTPAEELVYLIYIEEVSEEDALKIIDINSDIERDSLI